MPKRIDWGYLSDLLTTANDAVYMDVPTIPLIKDLRKAVMELATENMELRCAKVQESVREGQERVRGAA